MNFVLGVRTTGWNRVWAAMCGACACKVVDKLPCAFAIFTQGTGNQRLDGDHRSYLRRGHGSWLRRGHGSWLRESTRTGRCVDPASRDGAGGVPTRQGATVTGSLRWVPSGTTKSGTTSEPAELINLGGGE